jgi:hypothetical protein
MVSFMLLCLFYLLQLTIIIICHLSVCMLLHFFMIQEYCTHNIHHERGVVVEIDGETRKPSIPTVFLQHGTSTTRWCSITVRVVVHPPIITNTTTRYSNTLQLPTNHQKHNTHSHTDIISCFHLNNSTTISSPSPSIYP